MTDRKGIGYAALILFAGFSLIAATEFEQPAALKASAALRETQAKGSAYQISDPVLNDGYTNAYTIESKYGVFVAYGDSMLAVRLQEIEGIAKLKEVSSSEAFAKAAVGKVMKPVEAAKKVVEDPVGTAKGVPGGIKTKFENLGRLAKRATKKDEAVDPVEAEEDSAETESAAATGSKQILGVTAAHRKWAQQAGVDPYSANVVLQDELNRLAKVEAATGLAIRITAPDVPGVKTVTRVYDLAWGMDPQELQKLNEKRLKEMGVDSKVSESFIRNKHLTLTHQTSIVASLYELSETAGRTELVRAASTSQSERDAYLYSDSAAMIALMKKKHPVTSFISNPRIAVLRSGNRLVAVLPADHLYWTAAFAKALARFDKRNATQIKGLGAKELWLSGVASDRSRAELQAQGWTIRENILVTNN